MLDKSDSDDQLAAALRAELDKARKGIGARGAGGGAGGGGNKDGIDYESRCKQLASRVTQQQTQVDRQEQIINALRDQLQQAQQAQQQQQQHGGDGMRCGAAGLNSRPVRSPRRA